MKTNNITRIRIISICILLFALLLIVRLYILQVVDHDTYIDKADRQYTSTAQKIFSRGTISFQNKDGTLVSAATLKSGYIVAVNPEVMQDPEDAYKKLDALLPTDHDAFIAKATKKNDPYEEIATKVEEDIGDRINALDIPGLTAFKERWRFYPGGQTAAHILGILGYKGDDYAGRYGLERQYETELEREDGAYVNFFAEMFSNIKKAATGDEEEADVVTTIEPTVQSYLEGILASTTEKWSSQMTGGIIMDPSTGEIYAMETYPTFDPNHPENVANVSIFSDNLVESVREMGSIIKPLTLAAGIDAGVVTPSSTYDDKGYVMVSGKKISDFDGKDRGIVTMQDMLSQSLNVGAVHVEQLLGAARFSQYMLSFGLEQKTGIELPNEAKNLVSNLHSSVDVDLATAAFGQGIAMTPISTIRALAVVANGGLLVNPHVVKSLKYKIGTTFDTPVGNGVRVLKPETSETVARMMTYSVDNVLSQGKLKIPNYSVAAKTGTAQIAKPGGGGYYDDQFLHSFVGFFPSYNPKFIIFLYTLNPQGAQFGSETLTQPFMDIVHYLINYYEIPPDR
jgi:cell division protein FtsI/penicillin-binding protein 2